MASSRVPPLLDGYVRLPPEASLVLLSGVLGSTTNWLLCHYLCSLLLPPPPATGSSTPTTTPTPSSSSVQQLQQQQQYGADAGAGVVLVSFLRDYAFWRESAGRLGVDLDLASRRGRLVFVDGLSGLFSSHSPASSPDGGRGPQAPTAAAAGAAAAAPGEKEKEKKHKVLTSATAEHLRGVLGDALDQLQQVRAAGGGGPGQQQQQQPTTVLMVDQPDLLLAAAGDQLSGQQLRDVLLDLREKVHSSIVTVSADEPLITTQTTPLEKEHASFAVSLAHDAHLVISLRLLDTGTARDVSGVLRITPGGAEDESDAPVEERELLYFIGGDGGARVFERGQ
ncbi:hypothetical protein GGR56DRAFT_693350 [Xylariaceae sp. FL0804]|nr:hypothetical protein GGR56DRAFT_693350 [Xylariaceae sp. FL0804]